MSLRRSDLDAILAFVAEVGELEFDTLYPPEVVARVATLIPCLDIHYQEMDLRARRTRALVPAAPEDDGDDVLYWSLGPCPIVAYRAATGNLGAVRLSDVVDWRNYLEMPVYREVFRPDGVEHMADLALPGRPGMRRSFILFRGTGDGDFSERDRDVLNALYPHLRRFEAVAALRRRLAVLTSARERPWETCPPSLLSAREQEVVQLVAQGKTNAEIAADLWISPGTVKKHLDNVYQKLGIGHRSAAATYAASFR